MEDKKWSVVTISTIKIINLVSTGSIWLWEFNDDEFFSLNMTEKKIKFNFDFFIDFNFLEWF
jgi:hypothetical protein